MDDDRLWPSRADLDREAYEEWLAATYEERFLVFCGEHWLDPQDLGSVLAYEDWWEEQRDLSS